MVGVGASARVIGEGCVAAKEAGEIEALGITHSPPAEVVVAVVVTPAVVAGAMLVGVEAPGAAPAPPAEVVGVVVDEVDAPGAALEPPAGVVEVVVVEVDAPGAVCSPIPPRPSLCWASAAPCPCSWGRSRGDATGGGAAGCDAMGGGALGGGGMGSGAARGGVA